MAYLTKQQLSEHSTSYWRLRPFWTDALNLKEPLTGGLNTGSDTLGFYLNRYAQEDNGEWLERLKRLAQVNFVDLVVDQYCSMLFSTSIVVRAEKHQDAVDRFTKRCTLQGDSLTDFAREIIFPNALVYGVADVFVDKPSLGGDDTTGAKALSVADQKALGLDTPYIYVVPPLNRVAYRLDDARQYVEYRSIDVINTQVSSSTDLKDKNQYNFWTPTQFQQYDDQGTVLADRVNPYGFIPCTTIMPWPSLRFHNDKVGMSLVKDVIPLQKMVLNLISLIFDFHEAVNFAHRILIQDTDNGEEPAAEGELNEMGNHRAFALRGKGSKFEIVTPESGGVDSMCRFLDQVINMIFKCVYLPSDSNINKTHQTGDTIRSNHAQLYNKLTQITKYGEKALRQIVEMALRVQGIDPAEANVTVTWNTNFSFDSFISSIEQLTQLRVALGGHMSPTAEAEFAKKIIEPQLYNTGTLDEINAELDKYVVEAKKQVEQMKKQQQAQIAQAAAQPLPTVQQENTQANAASKVASETE